MDQPDPTPPDEDVLSSQIIERLLRYDELEEAELAELEADPSVRTELHRLQLAEAWLTEPSPAEESNVEALADSSPCPSAEDLFDFGQKLEPTALEISRQVELAEHIETCAECAGLVAKLANRPPSPLIVVDSPLPEARPEPAPRPRSSRAIRRARGPRPVKRPGLRHVPFLVAASLLAVLVLSGWPSSVLGKEPSQFPNLRGTSSQRLVSPRNFVLSRSTDLPGLPRLSDLVFEVRPEPGPARYDVFIYTREETLNNDPILYDKITSSEPTLRLPGPLPEGRYSWNAIATPAVSGIPRDLGHSDFRVIADRGLEEALMKEGETVEAVEILAENYLSDARALARHLVLMDKCNQYEAERRLAITPVH